MRKYIKLFLFIFLINQSFAQSGSVLLQLDGSLYSAGESVYGAMFFLGINANEKVVKIELIDTESNVIESFFVKVKNDYIDFNIDLPYNSASADYQVLVTTIDGSNNSITLGRLSLFCLSNVEEQIQPSLPTFVSDQAMKVNAEGHFEVFKNHGSEVQLKSKGLDKILTVAIADIEWEDRLNVVLYKNKFEQKDVNNWPNKIFYQGNLEKKNQPIEWNILGLYDNQLDQFNLSKSDKNGKFTYLLNDFDEVKYFQLLPYGNDVQNIALKKPKYEISPQSIVQKTFTQKEIATFDTYKLKNRIGQYFIVLNIEKKNSVLERKENLMKSQKNYFPGTFKKFEYFYQFCKENNVVLQFKEKEKTYFAHVDVPAVYAKKFNIGFDYPLFIINGLVTTNYDFIARIKTKDIESFDLYLEPEDLRKAYNIFGAQTVVKMKTKSDATFLSETEKRNTVELRGFKKMGKSNQLKIIEKRSKNLKPIFEAHLLFQTNQEEITFVKSDDKAIYKVFTILQKGLDDIEIIAQELDLRK